MTTPPAPPAPPPAPPTDPPAPPAPTPPAPSSGPPEDPAAELAKVRAALEDERRQRRLADEKIAQLTAATQTDQEKALTAAKAEGRAEAAAETARLLAAAEFRAAAAGRLADPEGALAVLDLDKLVKEGKPDQAAITAAVDKLAAAPAPPGRVPSGPREGAPPGSGDFFRDTLGRGAR